MTPQMKGPQMKREMKRETKPKTASAGGKPGGEKSLVGKVVGGIAGLAIVAGLAIGFGSGAIGGGKKPDTLSQQDIAARAAVFEAALKKGPMIATPVPAEKVEQEVAKLHLQPEQAKQLKESVQRGEYRMLTLGFYDNVAEDGDSVQIRAAGLDVRVDLLFGANYISFPAPVNGPVDVEVTGIQDGGGGVTVAAMGPGGPLPLPVLSVGQTVHLKVQ